MSTAFFRTIILYVLLIAGLRLTGKRQIGELEPGELVLALLIADLASVPMQDLGIPLINGVLPILTLLSLSLLVSRISLKSVAFRTLVCGRPTVIIREGRILQKNMARTRLTVDELLEQLRAQGYSSPQPVKYAILETSGRLSVLPCAPSGGAVSLPVLLISDGLVLREGLQACGKSRAWLEQELNRRGVASCSRVFLMTLAPDGAILCIPKEDTP